MSELDDSSVWILSNYRSGSKRITRYLKWLYGTLINEPFTPYTKKDSRIKKLYPETIFGNNYSKWKNGDLLTRRALFFKYAIKKSNYLRKMKLMRTQFFFECGLNDSDKEFLEKVFNYPKYIFIKRTNTIDLVCSFYIALKTHIWADQKVQQKHYKEIPIVEKELDEYLKYFKEFNEINNWEMYLGKTNHFFVDFDNLFIHTFDIYRGIADYLNKDVKNDEIYEFISRDYTRYVKTVHPQSKEIKSILINLATSAND